MTIKQELREHGARLATLAIAAFQVARHQPVACACVARWPGAAEKRERPELQSYTANGRPIAWDQEWPNHRIAEGADTLAVAKAGRGV